MKLLLWLYPRSWRDRYRPEMEELLDQARPTPRVAWDLVRGGLDARMHPQWPGRRQALKIGRLVLALAVGLGGFAAVSIAGQSRPAAAGAAISFALGALLVSRRPGRRRRGPRDCGGDDDAGAGVPAKPRPGAPPALVASSPGTGRRSGPE